MQIIRHAKTLLTRSLILYGCILAVFWLITDHEKLRIKAVNYLALPIDYLLEFSLGEKELDLRRVKEYEDFYTLALKEKPGSVDILHMLAFCRYYLGRPQKALALYKEAVAIDPLYFWSWYNLAVIHYNQGNYEETIENLRYALGVPSRESIIRSRLSIIFTYAGDVMTDDANFQDKNKVRLGRDAGNLVENLNWGYKKSLQLIILSERKLKNYESILQWTKRAVDTGIDDPGFLGLQAGIADYHLGRYREAVADLEKSLTWDAQNAQVYYYLSLCLAKMGEKERADFAMERAKFLDWDPAKDIEMHEEKLRIY